MKTIYFDNAATTQVAPEVIKKMQPYFSKSYGNASSMHHQGVQAKKVLEDSRKIIADSINADAKEIIFTSGGTESNNFALKSIAFSNKAKGNHIITTEIEHKCVLNACNWLENQGFKVTYLKPDKEGFISPKDIEKAITPKTILVSVIHGHNEVGTIQDIDAIGKLCRQKGIYFHTDACQSYTKIKIDVQKQNVDLMTLNSHKIHGPKGVGALYIRKGTKIDAWQHGGGHESGLRSGTENISGIAGFAEAVSIAMKKQDEHISYMTKLRDKLINLIEKIPGTKLNGSRDERLCNNVNFSFRGIEGEAIGGLLNEHGICSSTGSACSERNLEASYVLMSMGCTHEEANGSLRLTLSRYTTEEEADRLIAVLPKVIEKLRKISPYGRF